MASLIQNPQKFAKFLKLKEARIKEIERDWRAVCQRFGELAEFELLAEIAAKGFAKLDRGTVFLLFQSGKAVITYACQSDLRQALDESDFKQRFLKIIETYNFENQMVILVSSENMNRVQYFSCQYFVVK